MLSSAAYLNAAFPSPAPPVPVTSEQRDALVALNNAATAAQRAFGRDHQFSTDIRMMAHVVDSMVDGTAPTIETTGD